MIFSGVNRYTALCIINSLLLFSGSVSAQCPDNGFFKKQINSIYTSPKKKPGIQLDELLRLQQQMKTCRLEDDSCYMFLFQKIGVVYSKLSNYPKAIAFTKESVYTAEKCVRNQRCNTLALIHSYYNLFYFYRKMGQVEKGYEAFDSCLVYVLRDDIVFDRVVGPLAEKTDYLFNKGEYSLCVKDARLGEAIINKHYPQKDSLGYIIFFIGQQANALYFSGNIIAAETLLRDKISRLEKTGNSNRIGAFYNLLGLIYRDNRNYLKALAYFQTGFRADSVINERKGCAQSLASIGTLYSKYLNKHDIGLSYCTRALKSAVDASDSLFILQQTGNIYVLKEMFDKAQYVFQQAYNTLQQGMNEITILKNPVQYPGFNLLQNLSDLATSKGDAYVQQYHRTKNSTFLEKALKIYRMNDLFLAKIKTEQHLQFASNLVWRRNARSLYEHAIGASYAGNNTESAFYFFEQSRAVLLNDQINEQRWMADVDIAKVANLKKIIVEWERSLLTTPASSDEHLAIQKKLYNSYLELDILISSIKNKNPLFYHNYLDTIFVTVAQLRKSILNNTKTLVEIFSGDSAVYVLTISPNNQVFTKINKQLYDSVTKSFNSFITNPDRLNRHFADFIKTAHQLYRLLFQNKAPSYGSIIISPDGITFPFEALVMNANDREPEYFLNHYATSYTYSVKYLTNQFSAGTNTSNSVLGIAPVQYKNHKNLAELAGSDVSLKNISSYFSNATNYVLEKATKNNFQQNFSGYNIIQLYTHAADSSLHNDPVIYFADSALYLSDLIPTRKPVTQLIVLSACETANGKLYEGEGIFSFNRGFAALGIPAAISNLWSVDNVSTYLITELFYKYLAEGLPTDIALQKAKLEFVNTTSSKEKKLPWFWAGPILTGKVNIIKNGSGFPWKEFSGALILLLATAYFAKVFFRRTSKPGLT